MAASDTAAGPRLRNVDVVVDTDVHLTERQEDVMPYLPDPWKQVFSRSGGDDYGFLSNLYPSPGLVNPVTTGKVRSEPVRSRERVAEGMAVIGSDRAVVTPTLNLYLSCVRNEDLAAALAHAYNEFLLDRILDPDDGIYGAAVVASQRPDRAAEEIDDRASEPGIAAVFMPTGGAIPLMGDRTYDPIYAACEDAGLPLMTHNASGNFLFSSPIQFQLLTRFLSMHAVAHPIMHMCSLADLLTRGVPVRFPDLEFVFQEAGIGYVPFFMRRFDHEYHSKQEDAPMLEQAPSEYLKDQFYFTSQPMEGTGDPEYVEGVVRAMDGANTLMFSSDYPHLDFDDSDELANHLPSFDDDEIAAIYGGTALEVFGF